MRLNDRLLDLMAFAVAKEVIHSEMVEAELDRLADLFRRTIQADLKVEDDLEIEVHAKLAEMGDDMRRQGVDHSEMFDKVKKMLVRERKLIL